MRSAFGTAQIAAVEVRELLTDLFEADVVEDVSYGAGGTGPSSMWKPRVAVKLTAFGSKDIRHVADIVERSRGVVASGTAVDVYQTFSA